MGSYTPPSKTIQENKSHSKGKIYQFPLKPSGHQMMLVFKSYRYRRPGTVQLNRLNTNTVQELSKFIPVLLPLPSSLQDSYQISISSYESGIRGESISTAASGIENTENPSLANIASSFINASTFNPKDITQAESSFDSIIRAAAFLGRRTIDNTISGAARNLDVGFGNTINPKISLYFEGIGLKDHSFQWNLAPTSSLESDILKDIITLMKREVLPSYSNTIGFSRALLNYPSTVDIFFVGLQQEYFFHYKTCMAKSLSVNYAPNGLSFVKGGKPAMIDLSLDLTEMDIHTAEDYGGISVDLPSSSQNTIS